MHEVPLVSDERLRHALPCPFCGSAEHLSICDWWDDTGVYDAVECLATLPDGSQCRGAAPMTTWNHRPALPDPLGEALNSGDGSYRP